MIDINFYMKIFELKKRLMRGDKISREQIVQRMDQCRGSVPVIYNIETTNACNMRCEMCPRTTQMTRAIENLDMVTYKKIVDQISPFEEKKWGEWEDFVEEKYKIGRNETSENHFFLYIIPKVIVLHGYGAPLLDQNMAERIRLLTEKGIPSYFSCNPANINIEKIREMFQNGLGYIKFSIESVDDKRHKEIRGGASNYTESHEKILQLLDLKKKHRYETDIVVTMLNLRKPWQMDEFRKLQDAFRNEDVYVYLKSQDQQWYQDNTPQTESIHWQEFCQFPWSSMTIKSNGEAVMCVEDYNNEIILGDAKKESLVDIWNGEKYQKFRENQFNLANQIKCTEKCDMKLIGSFFSE